MPLSPQIENKFKFSPIDINQNLYKKFASSQSYYYSNIISEISKEKRTSANITYQDVEYMCDSQQYLKRFYGNHEYNSKMFTFKEYYFYHQDCPRIFMKGIEQYYSKWQDRKRDLVYKRLKILYNESFSTQKSSSKQDDKKSATGVTHFLLQISDYNPFSKKYYLRVQAKRKKQEDEKKSNNFMNRTKNDISNLNHQLSMMLTEMSQLSNISTLLEEQESPRTLTLYHSKKLKVNYSSQYSTHNTQNNSNSNSRIKFNFKKDKPQKEKMVSNHIVNDQINRKLSYKQKSQQKFQILSKASPKYVQNKINDVFKKTNSVFKLSQFNSNKKGDLQIVNSHKKQPLKLTTETKKNSSSGNRIFMQNQAVKNYDSQKKTIISKSQSVKKVNKIDFKSIQKRSSFSNLRKLSVKQSQIQGTNNVNKGVFLSKEFSDSKLTSNQNPINEDSRFRSHKSEYNTNSKFSTIGSQINFTSQNSKKNLFKIKDVKDSGFKLSGVGTGKKGLELKLH